MTASNDNTPVFSLRRLSLEMRVLLSAFLLTIGTGYLAALTYLYLTDVDPHQKMAMGLVQGIIMKYRGEPDTTRLEAALRTSMSDRLSKPERDELLNWVRSGAGADGYQRIRPVLEKNCLGCHSPASGLSLPSLATFADVSKLVQRDTGPTVGQLARVSHVHLFGISIIFLLTGGIFAMSPLPAVWRGVVLVAPYVAIWADIGSWWLTKESPVFGYVVVGGGALMGVALAVQIFVSLWEMWVASRTP